MTLRGLIFTPIFLLWTALRCLSFSWMLFIPPRDFLPYLRRYERELIWLERHVLGLTYVVEGELPRSGAALIAMKHQSLWETMKLHLLIDHPAIVLKKELLDIPFWGRYARFVDLVPIDRSAGREAVSLMTAAADRAVAAGRPIVIFPQGTRVSPGKTAPYKSGIGYLYASTGLPIIPVALNSGLFWPKKLFRQRGGRITMRVLSQIPAGLDPREAMRQLEQALENASNQLIAEGNSQ
jgi:1-acyl-sn-glycerol-3-phosphate acyltransferase